MSQFPPISKSLETIIFVGGPTGSGKTTLVTALSECGQTYEEKGEDNPYLMRHIRGEPLDAVANQHWFLDKVMEFVGSVPARVAVVDQHPLGIGLAYSQLFRDEGLIKQAEADSLARAAYGIYSALAKGGKRVLTVALTASSETLWRRCTTRAKGPRLSRERICRVNELFQKMVYVGDTMPINSEILNPEQERDAVVEWLRQGARSSA